MSWSSDCNGIRVCFECISEEYLQKQIIGSNDIFTCDECNNPGNPTIEFDVLAEMIHVVLEKYYYLTPENPEGYEFFLAKEGAWERSGEMLEHLIEDLAGVSSKLANEIIYHLSNQHDANEKDALYDGQLYSGDPYYAESDIETFPLSESWRNFKNTIYQEARFFNEQAKTILDDIFKGVGSVKTPEGGSVIRTITEEVVFYRSRVALSNQSLEEILKNLPSSIGPPNSEIAGTGRMNAQGISVFYGALDKATCLAEVRAPVGSHVVTGRFSPVRKMRLLDLSRMQDARFETGSAFNEEHMKSVARLHFLRELTRELSAPVMPGSESREYLPTQVVAEYLAVHPALKLDGLIFNSSQTPAVKDANNSELGKNVLLFYRASSLREYDHPRGMKIDVTLTCGNQNDCDDSITIYEELPKPDVVRGNSEKTHKEDIFDTFNRGENIINTLVDSSIQLDMDSVEVDGINGVEYHFNNRQVSRHREIH